jgi:hypothetical protein
VQPALDFGQVLTHDRESESIVFDFRFAIWPKMRNKYGMGRPKGLAKTGGRKLGTPNKNSQALSARLESLSCQGQNHGVRRQPSSEAVKTSRMNSIHQPRQASAVC